MSIFKSPLVSCLTCRKIKSARGIFSHYITAHTESGNERVKKNSKIYQPDTYHQQILATEKRYEYSLNPILCKICNNPHSYNKRKNKFCSRSCATTNSNNNRDRESYILAGKSLSETINNRPKFSKIELKSCKECNILFWFSSARKDVTPSFCSSLCSVTRRARLASEHFKRIGAGGVKPSSHIDYRGITLCSSYEVNTAIVLDELNIKWEKATRVKYTLPCGKYSNYTADFFLPEYNLYLDPKNDFLIHNVNPGNGIKDIDKIAFVVEQNKISVAIIDVTNINKTYIKKLVGHEGFEPSVILSCKDSGFDHSHQCPVIYL